MCVRKGMSSCDSSRVVIADLPIEERPRERLARQGAESLSDAELLALLIAPGNRDRSSIDLAREALRDGLDSLARKDWRPAKTNPLGPARMARIAAALELGRRIASTRRSDSEPVADAVSLGPVLIARYSHHAQERLGGIYLDSRGRVLREREIYVGTLTSASVSPRDIFRFALEESAASVILFHNHPSGDPSPSAQDLQFTKAVVAAGKLLDVRVLDHLIIGSQRYVSLLERGMM